MSRNCGFGRWKPRDLPIGFVTNEIRSASTELVVAMASSPHSQRPYEYLDALLATLPHESIPQDIASTSRGARHSSSPYPKFIDTALRLVSGGSARADEAPHLRDAWPDIQASIQRALDALHPQSSSQAPTKRKLSLFPSREPKEAQIRTKGRKLTSGRCCR